MTGKKFVQSTVYGTIAGTLLACFFYCIEKFWNINLYTFLVNIDFLPLPDNVIYSAPLQFLLHILISIVLIILVDILSDRGSRHPYLISILINMVMSFTFFPLYWIAVNKPFYPPLLHPFAIWLIGHLIFAVLIGYFVSFMHKKEC